MIKEKLKESIKTNIWNQLDCFKAYAIFEYVKDSVQYFDVFVPYITKDKFYFTTHKADVPIEDIAYNLLPTGTIVNEHYNNALLYTKFEIQEFSENNHGRYCDPIETNAFEYFNQGNSALESNKCQEALHFFSIAVSKEPYNEDYYYAKAKAYNKIGDMNRTIGVACKGILANPISKQNVFLYGYEAIASSLGKKGLHSQAIRFYSKSIDFGNNSSLPYRSKCFVELGKIEHAIKDLDIFLKKNIDIEFMLDLGKLYIRVGNVDEAKKMLNKVIDFNPSEYSKGKTIELTGEQKALYERSVLIMNEMNRPVKDQAMELLYELG